MAEGGTQRRIRSAWPRTKRDQSCDPFDPPLPRYSGPQSSGHLEMPTDACAHMDRVLDFIGIKPEEIRGRWLDSKRHGSQLRLSWIIDRSFHDPAETWKHLRVCYAYDHIVLREGATLELETPFEDPLEVYVHKLTMLAGAKILLNGGNITLCVGQWVGTPQPGADQPELLLTSEDGGVGQVGNAGQDGVMGDRDHSNGGNASAGANGGPGRDAAPLGDCAVAVHTMTGHGRVTVRPGRGGAGGPGQPGGRGGRGASISFFKIGEGGAGGNGGDGGMGGAGGNAGQLRLDFRNRQPESDVIFDISHGMGGTGGPGAAAGLGGLGNPDGRPGRNGRTGDTGPTGRPPQIRWVNKWGETP